MDLSTSIPCGLIINELITNSFKYAQQPGKKLKVDITLQPREGGIYLAVKDNGPGISEHFHNEKSTLGMELIESLTEQINGKGEFKNNNGASYEVIF